MCVICPIHGDFFTNPDNHVRLSVGCPKCGKIDAAKNRTMSSSEFFNRCNKFHKNKYSYIESFYSGYENDISILCPVHGKFKQKAGKHLHCGCKKCANENLRDLKIKSSEEFTRQAGLKHNERYLYSKIKYQGAVQKVEIVCIEHGSFWQSASAHLSGAGCPNCKTKNEFEVYLLLTQHFNKCKIKRHKKIWDRYRRYIGKRYCDFWFLYYGQEVIVEYDGEQHFRPVSFGCRNDQIVMDRFSKQQKIDMLDKLFCQEHNIILFRIPYYEDKEKSIKILHSKLIVEST